MLHLFCLHPFCLYFDRADNNCEIIMNPNETRSSHPSSAQLETLVEFMERNPGIAKGFLRTPLARERSRRTWEELTVRLNNIGGTFKTYKQWTKYWADKKSAIKKKVAARSAARQRTGGGVEDEVELSEIEERVVALCGGENFSKRDAHPHRPRTVCGSKGGSVSSHTSSVAAPPPSQQRTEVSTTTERFLRVAEQQLDLQRLYAQILQAFLEKSAERDRILAEAVAAVGKGLQALAEAINKD